MWHRDHRTLAAELPDLIVEHHLEKPMAWVLGHTDRTFQSTIGEELGLSGAVSEDWLHTARGPGDQDLLWTGTMRDRLHLNSLAPLLRPRPEG
jgi:hypothetical protein